MTQKAQAENFLAAEASPPRFVTAVRVSSLFLALSIVSIAWVLSTPPGSSPAERETMLAVVCGLGGATPQCSPDLEDLDELQVSGGWGDDPCYIGWGSSAECLPAGYDLTQFKTTVLYEQLPTTRSAFHGVLRELVGNDPYRSLIQMRLFITVLGSALLTASLVLLRGRAVNYLSMWFAVGVPVVLLLTASVTKAGWQLITIPSLIAAMVVLRNCDSQRYRIYASTLAVISVFIMLLSGIESIALILAIISTILFISKRASPVSYHQRNLLVHANPNDMIEPMTGWWQRIAQSPITLWVSISVLILVNFQQHLWKQTLFYLPSQLGEYRLFRTIFQLPNFVIEMFGAGSLRLGYSDLTFPSVAVLCSIAVISVVAYIGLSEARWNLKVRLAVLGLLFVGAVVIAHERLDIEIGGDLALPIRFLPYFIMLVLIVPLYTEKSPRGNTAHLVNGLVILALAASLWSTLRRYVTGFPDSPDFEGPCLFCDVSPQLWWWSRWYEPVVGPRLTWLCAVAAMVWAFSLASKLSSESKLAESRGSQLRAIGGLVILTFVSLRLTLPWLFELSPPQWAQ